MPTHASIRNTVVFEISTTEYACIPDILMQEYACAQEVSTPEQACTGIIRHQNTHTL
jgi:hypothetical protein